MERVDIGGGVHLSRMVYGMWRLADDPDHSPRHVQAKVEACLEQGITTMDHADIYGDYRVEEIFGAALKGTGLREKIEIVTKCGIIAPAGRYADRPLSYYDTSSAHIRASVDMSLRLMGADRIDLLLIHRPDPFMDFADTAAGLDAVVAAGKVRRVGVSNFRPWDLAALQAAMTNRLAVNQIEISLQAHEAFTDGDLSTLTLSGMRAMAWSPLGGGRLMADQAALGATLDRFAAQRGVDRAAVAVAWLLAHPAGILPVMGTNNLVRIHRLHEAFKVGLSREEWFILYEAATGREVP